MNELQMKNQTIDSREVAEMVGKEHKELLRDIRTYEGYLGESKIALTDFFIESTYLSTQNKELPNYQVTKKGCEFIAHKLTGQKGTAFTAKYINRFHEMEQTLSTPRPMSMEDIMIYSLQEMKSVKLQLEQQKTLIEDSRNQVIETKKEVQNIRDTIIINPKAEWREATNKILNNIGNQIGDYQAPRNEAYETLKVKGACRPKILVENLKSRALKNGMSKSKVDKLCILDVLENEPRLKEIYISIVKEMGVKNGQGIHSQQNIFN